MEEKSSNIYPCVEWEIAFKCNYHCPYCFKKKIINRPGRYFANKRVLNSVLSYIQKLSEKWEIKFVGAEPTQHPDFLKLCEEIVKCNRKISITTNFSLSHNKLRKLVDICDENLVTLCASFHSSQVNIEEFFEKAYLFKSIKKESTKFLVTSVVTHKNIDTLQKLKNKLVKEDIPMIYQWLQKNNKPVEYNEEITRVFKNSEQRAGIKNNFFGKLCYTGKYFFCITPRGDVYRCPLKKRINYMGNVTTGNFRFNTEPSPCLSLACCCDSARNRNMITDKRNIKTLIKRVPTFLNSLVKK